MKVSTAKTQYLPTSDYERREHDDDKDVPLWPTGSVYGRVVTWGPAFWRIGRQTSAI